MKFVNRVNFRPPGFYRWPATVQSAEKEDTYKFIRKKIGQSPEQEDP